MMTSHHKKRDNGNGLDRVSEYTLTHKCHRYHKFKLWSFQNLMMYQMRTFTSMNPSSPSAGPQPPAEQRGRSRRDERSRSRERVPPHSPSHANQQPQPVVPPSGVEQTQTLATQGADEDSATVDPQNRVSGRARSTRTRRLAETGSTKRERKLLRKSSRVNYRKPKSTSP